MKLKSFLKVCNATNVRFNVYAGKAKDGEFLDTFTVDYIGQDVETLNKNIRKRFDLVEKGAVVEYVDVINGKMHVDVIVKAN